MPINIKMWQIEEPIARLLQETQLLDPILPEDGPICGLAYKGLSAAMYIMLRLVG